MTALKIFTLKAYREEIKGLIRDNRVIWTAEELGLDYERVAMNPATGEHRSEAFLQVNPFGKVPAIQDGDFVLFESAAICQYLAERHQKLIPPPGTPEYYECLQWSFFATGNIEPHAYRVFGCDFTLPKSPGLPEIRQLAMATLERFLPVLNDTLEYRSTLLRSGFSVADILLTTSLLPAHRSQILEAFPNVWNYLRTMTERPAFQKSQLMNGF